MFTSINKTSTPSKTNKQLDQRDNSQLTHGRQKQTKTPPMIDISNDQDPESFQSTFNYCYEVYEVKDDLNENHKLIEENQNLKQTLEKQDQEIGKIEYIHRTKNLFFSKGINHENNLYLFEDLIKELKLNSIDNWSSVKTYFLQLEKHIFQYSQFLGEKNDPVYQNQLKLVNWTISFLTHPNVSNANTCFIHMYTFKNLAGLKNHLRSSKHENVSELLGQVLMCKWANLRYNNLTKSDVEFILGAKLTSETNQQDLTFRLNLINHHVLIYNIFTNRLNFQDIVRIVSDCLTKSNLPKNVLGTIESRMTELHVIIHI